jgi:hypothetical protein
VPPAHGILLRSSAGRAGAIAAQAASRSAQSGMFWSSTAVNPSVAGSSQVELRHLGHDDEARLPRRPSCGESDKERSAMIGRVCRGLLAVVSSWASEVAPGTNKSPSQGPSLPRSRAAAKHQADGTSLSQVFSVAR